MTATQAKTNNSAAYRWTVSHTAHMIPAWKSYATGDSAQSGVYCEGCHSWGTTKLNGLAGGAVANGKASGSTLRAAFKSYDVANTDYIAASSNANGGLCISCHEAGSAIDAPSSGTTNALNALTAADYENSFHDYSVPITRKAKANGITSAADKTFNANCEKCHNSAEPIADPANNKDKLLLNPHYKDQTRLIAQFGIRADVSRPLDHNAVTNTTCESCHGAGQANVAHGGKRAGRCFEGCHSVEQVYSVAAHKTESWYASCQECHDAGNKPSTHPVAPTTCSTTTCHADMSVHVSKNEGNCYSGCHSPGEILNQKKADGTLAHKSTMASFAQCATCHTTNGSSAWTRTMNTRGMCFGCHARKGEISGNAGKNYVGKDWYGVANMNDAEGIWTTHTLPTDSTKTYVQTQYKNASGTVLGTQFYDEEGIFENMYNSTSAVPSGDGKDGATDKASRQALADSMEVAGHQPNRFKDSWKSVATLKPHVQKNFTSIRCSECHNTHATETGAMGGHTEWVLTKKALPGKTGGVTSTTYADTTGATKTTTVYADNTMPAGAIASDGSRLITLNDFWSRNELAIPVKNALVAYYKTYYMSAAGGSMSATDAATAAESKYEEMDYNGITSAEIAKATGTAENVGLAGQWSKTVDIFCYRCHDEKSMANKAHQGTSTQFAEYSHKKASLACVNCHLPEIHGGKLEGLLTDRGAYDTDNDGIADANDASYANGIGLTEPYSYNAETHKVLAKNQQFNWVAYQNGGKQSSPVNTTPQVLAYNAPAAKLFSVKPDPSNNNTWEYSGCSTDKSCHVNGRFDRFFGEQTGGD